MKRKGIDFKELFNRLTFQDSCLTIDSNKSVRIENCKRIIECNDMLIRLKTTELLIEIWGKDLKTRTCNDNVVIAFGEIESVNLEVNKK